MLKNSSPVIGILPDFQYGSENGGSENGYSKKDHYAIRYNYADSINSNGGIAILLTYNYSAIDEYLSMIDGLLVVGGDMDISPARYGDNFIHPKTKLNLPRENFEYEIVSKALQTSLPIFGICNGMQLISIIQGGKIIQHIPDNPKLMNHEQNTIPDFEVVGSPYHEVTIDKTSNFYKIAQAEKFSTNSSHHQAIAEVGNNLRVVGRTKDNVIEAFENPNHPFCVGVQWHPEYQTCVADKKLFIEFIKQSEIYKKQKFNK